MPTYEVKRPTDAFWTPAGEDFETAETVVQSRNERLWGSTIVWMRNNFNGSVTVFEVSNVGRPSNHGSYQRFYGTDHLPR